MIKGKVLGVAGSTLDSTITVGFRVPKETDVKETISELINGKDITIYVGSYKPSLYALVQEIHVNELKRTVTVKFKDGTVVTKKACECDAFDVHAGVALCIASYLAKSTKEFHKLVEKKTKSLIKVVK